MDFHMGVFRAGLTTPCTRSRGTFETTFFGYNRRESGLEDCSYTVTRARVDTGFSYGPNSWPL